MSDLSKWALRFKKGLRSRLPGSAAVGEPLFTTDTGELFVGRGPGLPLVKIGSSSTSVEPTVRLPVSVRGDFTDSVYYYYGVETSEGSWRVSRNLTSDVTERSYADLTLNPGVTSLNQAWPIRTSLVYSS